MPSYEWTQVKFWERPHLSYVVFIAISIIGGIIGLDHLYLRSPLTAFFKVLSFFALPFFWYAYDIIQSTAEKKNFLEYGLTTPFITTAGIGAGMFQTGDEKEKKEDGGPPSPFYFLGFVLLAFLPFGFDLFLIGDIKGGIVKLIMCLIPIIGWLYVGAWTIVNLFKTFFKTQNIFTEGVTHFGAPFLDPMFFSTNLGLPSKQKEQEKKMSFMDLMRAIWGDIKEYILGKKKEGEKDDSHGFFSAIFQRIGDYLQNKVIAKSPTLQKVVSVGEKAKAVAEETVVPLVTQTAAAGAQIGQMVTEAPATAAAAAEVITEEFKAKLPPHPTLQRGGGLVEVGGSATLALIGMLVIVGSLSLGKYMFVKFHTKEEKRADAEVPPTRREFVRGLGEGKSDAPPDLAAPPDAPKV